MDAVLSADLGTLVVVRDPYQLDGALLALDLHKFWQ
jgi:hypothetical protein